MTSSVRLLGRTCRTSMYSARPSLTRSRNRTAGRAILLVGVRPCSKSNSERMLPPEKPAIMAEVLGKPIRYQRVSFETYEAGFVELGMSDAMAQGMTDMARAKNEGLDNAEPRTPENTTPTSFRQWCEEMLKPAVLG